MRSFSSRAACETNSSGGSQGRSRWQSAEMRRYCMAPSGSDVWRSVKRNGATGARFFRGGAPLKRGTASSLEPDVVEPPAIVHAVDHRRQALDPGVPAGCAAQVEDDRPGALFLQPAVDLPDQLPAFFPVGFCGLTAERRFELAI